jgi:hypothetical protein
MSQASLYDIELRNITQLQVASSKKYFLVPLLTIFTVGIIHLVANNYMSVMLFLWYNRLEENVSHRYAYLTVCRLKTPLMYLLKQGSKALRSKLLTSYNLGNQRWIL